MISWHTSLISRSAKLFMRCTIQGVLFMVQSLESARSIDCQSIEMWTSNRKEPSASITDSSSILQKLI